jgi:hypothetical protein
MDLGPHCVTWLEIEKLEYLRHRYSRAGLAATYLIAESTVGALNGAYSMSATLRSRILLEDSPPLRDAVLELQPVSEDAIALADKASSGALRNGLLKESNILTAPSAPAVLLLQTLVLSAFLLTQATCPFIVRRVGEMRLLGDEREQSSTIKSLLKAAAQNPSKSDDMFWARVRNEILWLHDWGHGLVEDGHGAGVLGSVKRATIEAEILDSLLEHSRKPLGKIET